MQSAILDVSIDFLLQGQSNVDRILVGDLHELLITPEDHALVTIYTSKQTNLTEFGGASDGWIFENIFQEINIDTNVGAIVMHLMH